MKNKDNTMLSMKRKDDITFSLMCLPVILLVLLFSYVPMIGVIIAFENFNYKDGLFGSKFVGFKNFEFFFRSSDAWRITRNTIGMNIIFITLGLICAVLTALLIFEVKNRICVKTYQTILILPNFISWVIASYMVFALLNPSGGLINTVLTKLGVQSIYWYSESKYWPFILAIASVWKSAGLNSVIYYGSLMAIDSELFEAAELDGAGKLRQMWNISVPHLAPMMTILTILAIGGIFRADFGLFYQLPRNSGALYATTDVIDTYVYRALKDLGDTSMSAAVGLFQSVVGFVMIVFTNAIVNKINPENALF